MQKTPVEVRRELLERAKAVDTDAADVVVARQEWNRSHADSTPLSVDHYKRVSNLAEALARDIELGLPLGEEYIEAIREVQSYDLTLFWGSVQDQKAAAKELLASLTAWEADANQQTESRVATARNIMRAALDGKK